MSTAEEYHRFTEAGGFADLSARAKLRFTGADRVRYLNGQVTANVTSVKPDAAVPACVTTAKGKLCGDIFLAPVQADALFADAEPELREPLLERLGRYIIADDVTLDDVTDEFALVHFLPASRVQRREPLAGTVTLRAQRFGEPGWDVWIKAAAWAEQRATLSVEIPPLSESLLETLRIENGVPRWGYELGPDTLPPEAGLDRTHIDYHKGCYIGQETISRLRSVGHVNRALQRFVSPSGQPLLRGMQLFTGAGESKPLGEITSVAWSFALAKPIALGYLKRGSPTEGLLARPPHNEEPGVPIAVRDPLFLSS
jgi:folate-binding protein YgfZ